MNDFDYTRPVSEALRLAFGSNFPPSDTGGGCICLENDAPLQGSNADVYVLVGSCFDGPLLTADEREEYHDEHGRYDGYCVGVYGRDTGDVLAMVTDLRAETGEDVVALLRHALQLVPEFDGTYVSSTTGLAGTELRERLS